MPEEYGDSVYQAALSTQKLYSMSFSFLIFILVLPVLGFESTLDPFCNRSEDTFTLRTVFFWWFVKNVIDNTDQSPLVIGYSGKKTPHVCRHGYACWKPNLHTLFNVIVPGQFVHLLSLFSILNIQYYHGLWNVCPRSWNYSLETHHLSWSIISTALLRDTSTRSQSWYRSIDSSAIRPCTSRRFWEEAAFNHVVIYTGVIS